MIQQHLLPAGVRELDFTPVIIQHGRQRGRIQEQLKRKRKKEREIQSPGNKKTGASHRRETRGRRKAARRRAEMREGCREAAKRGRGGRKDGGEDEMEGGKS